MKHGTGQTTYKNGNIFTGDFIKDRENGNGQMSFSSGAIFNGIYIDGKRNGNGRIFFDRSQTEKFTGEWKDDVPGGGRGTYMTAEGDSISGLWVEGRIVVNNLEKPQFMKRDAV